MEYRITTSEDIELLMSSRLEMLKEVNHLPADYVYDDDFVANCRKHFLEGDQTTVLVLEDDKVVGCATICYMYIMPTFSHPTGKRAHLMNVYTASSHRRQGIAQRMLDILFEEAWKRGVTEISLDATDAGRPLYEKLGFVDSEECMVLAR